MAISANASAGQKYKLEGADIGPIISQLRSVKVRASIVINVYNPGLMDLRNRREIAPRVTTKLPEVIKSSHAKPLVSSILAMRPNRTS